MSDEPRELDWRQGADGKWYPSPWPVTTGDTTTADASSAPTAHGSGESTPPDAGGPNRTALFVTLGVLAAITGTVLIAALTSGGDDDDPQAGPSTTEGTGTVTTRETETTDSAPDTTGADVQVGSGDVSVLEVIEEGFSTYIYTTPDAPIGSFAFLIENTGDAAIVGAPMEVTILDEAGGTIDTAPFIIGVIRPGETRGYGAELISYPTNGIGDIVVEVRESRATYQTPAEGMLTASNISISSNDIQTTTTFSVSSTYSGRIDYAESYVIYRDTNGRIIGGGQGIVDSISPGDQQTGQIHNRLIPNTEEAEVYLDPAPIEA